MSDRHKKRKPPSSGKSPRSNPNGGNGKARHGSSISPVAVETPPHSLFGALQPKRLFRLTGIDVFQTLAQRNALLEKEAAKLRAELAASQQTIRAQGARIEELTQEAGTDPLTNLLNRRAGFLKLEQALATARREAKDFASAKTEQTAQPNGIAILLIDLDHFKRVNDTFGHDGGDAVLKNASTIMRQIFSRDTDIRMRYGGEEFLIAFPAESQEAAAEQAEKLRRAIEKNCVVSATINYPITISMGIAGAFPEKTGLIPDLGCEEMIKRADAALYAAKNNGRNRSYIAPANGGDPQPAFPVRQDNRPQAEVTRGLAA